MEIGEAILEDHEDHDMAEPQEPVETLLEKDSHKRNQYEHESSYNRQKGMALHKECIERERWKVPTIAMCPC